MGFYYSMLFCKYIIFFLTFFDNNFNSFIPSDSCINSSIFKKVSIITCFIWSFFIFSFDKNDFVNWSLTNVETSFPPWPSNTPNILKRSFSPCYISAIWESSILFLHPCIRHKPYLRILFSPLVSSFSVIGYFNKPTIIILNLLLLII